MTTYTWREFADAVDAKAGDIIVDGGQVEYISDIRVINKNDRANIISPERKVTLRRYWHEFEWEDEPGAGFSFDCFSDGSFPEKEEHNGKTTQEYFDSLKEKKGLKYIGIFDRERYFYEAALLKCVCGGSVVLDMVMTNTCDKCGRDYNSNGQLLAAREQWGEDTGESLSDILSADRSINEHEWELDCNG